MCLQPLSLEEMIAKKEEAERIQSKVGVAMQHSNSTLFCGGGLLGQLLSS